jgi:glucose-1-phosphate thymidylyltransferase
MNAIVLAAGYATRLRPLTDTRAKPLLPVGGRPMLDWIWDRLGEVPGLEGTHLVTNARYAPDFERWATGRDGVTVHDDGTSSNDDRLGAIGDIAFVLERTGIDDDLLVVAGDNLFDFSLADYVDFWRTKGVASCIAIHDVGDPALAKQYGVVAVDGDDRVVALVEKPEEPASTLVSTATYILHRRHVPLVHAYLEEGNAPDQPGKLFVWLHRREPVYGYRFGGDWLDIGTPEQLLEADNRLRAKLGLPLRAEYTLSAQSGS